MKLQISDLRCRGGYVTREFCFVMRDLRDKYGWKHIETRDLCDDRASLKEKILARFGQMPEVILYWEEWFVARNARDIHRLDCRHCVFSDDLHSRNEEDGATQSIALTVCDTALATYAYHFPASFPGLADWKKVVWVPHAASPDFEVPCNAAPVNAIFLSGRIDRNYPLRQQFKLLADEGQHPIVYHPHPGYDRGFDYENDEAVGSSYAAKINAYRAAFTDASTYRYVVAKYFEIPATGALLLADDSVAPQLAQLGLEPYVHYVPVSQQTLEDRVRDVLETSNHPQLDEIRRNGQRLVHARHRTTDRARLIDETCR